jgi:hypothetical protein
MWILFASLIVQVAAEARRPDSAPLEPMGRFDARAIPEASGIVKSRRYPGIFWVHNDSGNAPLLFAVGRDGRIVRRFRLAFPNLDWEDIAIDDQGHLYLGDIGNNAGLLRVRTIYRIDEPDPTSPKGGGGDRDVPLPATRTVPYLLPPSNRFDAEGLVYDRGTAILVAKYLDHREAELFAVTVDPPPAGPAHTPVRPIGRLPGFTEPATGADLSEDGTLLAVCSYAVTRVYRRERRDEAATWKPMAEVRYATLPIEGITWHGRDLILAAEEAQGLYRLREAAWRAAAPKEHRSRPKAK